MRRVTPLLHILPGLLLMLAVACGGSDLATPIEDTDFSETSNGSTQVATEIPGPDVSSVPAAVAPFGLGGVDHPRSPDRMVEVFNGLPLLLAGRERNIEPDTAGVFIASYDNTQQAGCGTVGIKAIDVSIGDFYPPNWRAESVIALFTAGADWKVEDFGREDALFWVKWNTTCTSSGSAFTDSIFTLSWGSKGDRWVFSVLGGDLETRDELVEAYVKSAR